MRTLTAIIVCCCLVMSLGCAMCDSSQDCKYAAFGGSIERIDMVNGRVNSVLNPASVAHTGNGSSAAGSAAHEMAPTPAENDQEDAPAADSPSEAQDYERRPGSPMEELDKLPRSENNAQEQLDSLIIPNDNGDTTIPESDGSPSLDDLFDDLQDAT